MTTEQTKIRLTTDEMTELRQLADLCGIQLTSLCAIFVRAGMEVVKENDSRLPLPLKFKIVEPTKAKK